MTAESLESWAPILREYDPLLAGSIDGTLQDPHDSAILRALNAKYRPNKNVVGDAQRTIFVGRLNHVTTEESLRQLCSECGRVSRVRVVRDIVTGTSKGYAFVEFVDERATRLAVKDLNGAVLDDMPLLVDFECCRTLKGWVPRRLGGGIGGKKESGQLRFGGRHRPFKMPYSVQQSRRGFGGGLHSFRGRDDGFQPGRETGRRARLEERDRDGRTGYRRRESDGDRGSYRECSRDSTYGRDREKSRDTYGSRTGRR